MPVFSLRTVSESLTAANRGRLLGLQARVRQRAAACGVELAARGVCCSSEQEEIYGRNVPAYGLVALSERTLCAREELQAAVLLHESLHLLISNQMFFPVSREYPEVWQATTAEIERAFAAGEEVLPEQEVSPEKFKPWEVNCLCWLGKEVSPEQIVAAIHEQLAALAHFIRTIGAVNPPPAKALYQRFIAAEVISSAFRGSHLVLPTLFLEEAFVNNLVPRLLGLDFHETLYAFPVDQGKVELSLKLNELYRGRTSELLALLGRKGQALVDGLKQMLPAVPA